MYLTKQKGLDNTQLTKLLDVPACTGVFAERCGAQDITAYHVDPEQLHNTKTTGIFTEAWLRRIQTRK